MRDDDYKLAEAMVQELADYQRREEELSWGLAIEDSEERAQHQYIKAKVQAGERLMHAIVSWHLERNDKEKRPTGTFRSDSHIPLSEHRRIPMPAATRDHVLQWQAIETDPRNQAYIASRLGAWEPQHKTLGDLERDKFFTQ
jgi:hypothetical protein